MYIITTGFCYFYTYKLKYTGKNCSRISKPNKENYKFVFDIHLLHHLHSNYTYMRQDEIKSIIM